MIGLSIKVHANGVSEQILRDIEKIEKELAYRIPDEARALMDQSVPSGRLYRRGGITGRRLKGLKRVGKSRAIVGTRIHRASAPGQPPAEDTGKLYRDITVRRMGSGNYRVRFGAGYAGYLEVGTGRMRARPFIVPAIERAIEKTFARYD